MDQPRLAHAGFADDRDYLAVSVVDIGQCLLKQVLLDFTADEVGEAARGGCLQSRSLSATARDLEDVDRMPKSFHQDGTERLDLDISLDETERSGGRQHGARHGQLLHSGGQMSGFADHGEVDEKIIAD